jgi:hypothetical protein
VSPLWRRFVEQIVNQPTFRDFCTQPGKWFRARENCFVAALATKQLDMKGEQFEQDGFWSGFRAIRLQATGGRWFGSLAAGAGPPQSLRATRLFSRCNSAA